MEYDPLVETMLVERSLDKIDEAEMEKEVLRLQEENEILRKQLGQKKKAKVSNNYDELVDENIKLKRKLGFSEEEILNSIKRNNPTKKSKRVWLFYVLFSGIIILVYVVLLIILLKRF